MLPQPVYGRLPNLVREYTADGTELVAYITKALYSTATRRPGRHGSRR